MLTAYKPEYDELWFKQRMLSDAATMSYNHTYGGVIPFPEECWKEWYDRWIVNADGRRYYRYLRNEDNTFIGEIAYHYDDRLDRYLADIIIFAAYRGKGCGSEALDMLCAAAKQNGILIIYDEIAIDNPAVRLFLKHGFTEEYRTEGSIMLKKVLQTDLI